MDEGVRRDGACRVLTSALRPTREESAVDTEMSWDDFLTEQDKAHLDATWSKTEPFGFGTRPAVLVIDDYYSVLGLKREPILESVKTWPMSTGLEGWAAIDRTVGLLASARAADVPIVYIKGVDGGFPAPWGRRQRSERLGRMPEEFRSKANEIVEEIAPEPGDLVIQKAAPSAFWGTPLSFYLQYHGIDTLICCGETTSGCVRATVVDGATQRFRMGVVGECCFDRTQASHYVNLFDMHQKYADVISVADASAYLASVAPAQAA
jgi:maleamate amidohydrolase